MMNVDDDQTQYSTHTHVHIDRHRHPVIYNCDKQQSSNTRHDRNNKSKRIRYHRRHRHTSDIALFRSHFGVINKHETMEYPLGFRSASANRSAIIYHYYYYSGRCRTVITNENYAVGLCMCTRRSFDLHGNVIFGQSVCGVCL